MADNRIRQIDPGANDLGSRLDTFLAASIQGLSRTAAAKLIEQGKCLVNDKARKPSYKLKPDDRVWLDGIDGQPDPGKLLSARPVPFRVIYEDDFILVIDKPAGLVVHPAAGHTQDTLVNGLLFHCPDIEGVGQEARPGIVHRLDRDTSGLMVIAKTGRAHQVLAAEFKDRKVRKKYLALVCGRVKGRVGRIDLPIGRHPQERKKMATFSPSGRSALTLWRLIRAYPRASLLELDLKTGRTHQIRVHCRSMGHPVVGDVVYGFRVRKKAAGKQMFWNQVRRQLLHAWQLSFDHPIYGRSMVFHAPLPCDFRYLLRKLDLPAR